MQRLIHLPLELPPMNRAVRLPTFVKVIFHKKFTQEIGIFFSVVAVCKRLQT